MKFLSERVTAELYHLSYRNHCETVKIVVPLMVKRLVGYLFFHRTTKGIVGSRVVKRVGFRT